MVRRHRYDERLVGDLGYGDVVPVAERTDPGGEGKIDDAGAQQVRRVAGRQLPQAELDLRMASLVGGQHR
nr:hypothetical protein [Frankia sp. QA3]